MSGIVFLILRIALATALYAFLGWAVYTIWQDLKGNVDTSPDKDIFAITLKQETPLSKNFSFDTPEVTIGRNNKNQLVLDDSSVSGYHASLMYKHDQWWLEDRQSTNGTYLNGERIIAPTVLTDSDLLQIGEIALTVSLHPEEMT